MTRQSLLVFIMPKPTFINLKAKKKKQFTDAFLREFAIKSYDEASLSAVVKELGIAKGSVYQYFEDKLDLFNYLTGACVAVKMKYIAHLKRTDYPDFWTFFRSLYEHGVNFDLENPLQSHFLHNLTTNINSPSVKELYQQMMDQTVSGFEQMVAYEVSIGKFRDDLPARTMGFFLYKTSLAINDELELTGIINPKQSIIDHQPVYWQKEHLLLEKVDDYISLMKKALDKN